MSYFQIIRTNSHNEFLNKNRIKFFEIQKDNAYYYINFSLDFFDILNQEELKLNTKGKEFLINIESTFYLGVGLMQDKESEEDVLKKIVLETDMPSDLFRINTLYKMVSK